jgi:4,5-dihydroxyphthalate decarboxylase
MIPAMRTAGAGVVWRTLLGDYPITRALRDGRVASPALRLDVADVAVPNKAFKRVVRDLEFDVAELALMTFLMARSRGVPLRLFPVVLFSRNPLRYLVCRADAPVAPDAFAGKSIGTRAYTTTTAVWARALLAASFGVDLDRLRWRSFEEAHVAGVEEPANVERAAAPADLVTMLLDGTIDAAIVDPVPADPRIAPVVADADRVWTAWQRATGAQTINHVVAVREDLATDAGRMAELFRLFRASREQAGEAGALLPAIGFAAMRRSLEVAIETADAQRLLARPLTVDDVTTAPLASLRVED